VPRESVVTTQDGVRLFVQTVGDGPTAVVVPNGLYFVDHFKHLAAGRTMIFVDPRHGGRSDTVNDPSKLERGIHHNVDDFEAVRRHFKLQNMALIGHSYLAFAAILYAIAHPAHVSRVVLIGPMEPRPGQVYPAHLTNVDDTLRHALAQLAQLRKQADSLDPIEFCRKFWPIVLPIYVVDPRDVPKLKWGWCDLPNQVNFMPHWTRNILPSLLKLNLAPEDLARVTAPVLVIHGRKDRSAPYGGGREWTTMLPNARLATIERAGHAPWIEDPDAVFGALATFLDGGWPERADQVTVVDE